jgi:hypothetical protein
MFSERVRVLREALPRSLGRVGAPGEIACVGPLAEAIAVGCEREEDGERVISCAAVAAVGVMGRGHVAALAHEGYLTQAEGDAAVEGRTEFLR